MQIDDYEKSYAAFEKDMDICFEKWSIFKNQEQVDLFFFPVHNSQHFFVACFNLQPNKRKYDFLDNKSEGGSSLDKFNNLPSMLQEHFSKWFLNKRLFHEASVVSELKTTRLEMKWRDQINDCDCVVYAMRLMETYQGNGLRE